MRQVENAPTLPQVLTAIFPLRFEMNSKGGKSYARAKFYH